MAGPMTHVDYVSDDGLTYRIREDASNSTAASNSAATATAHLPSGYIPRYVLASHPTTGRERKITIGAPDNPLFIGGVNNSITITDFGTTPSTQVAYNVFSRVGERRLNRG